MMWLQRWEYGVRIKTQIHEDKKPCPVRAELVEALSFLVTSKGRTALRQAQGERIERIFVASCLCANRYLPPPAPRRAPRYAPRVRRRRALPRASSRSPSGAALRCAVIIPERKRVLWGKSGSI